MKNVFITAAGTYLPNKAVSNDEMETYLGFVNGKKSKAKKRVLEQNGIHTRYYAIDQKQKTTHSKSELAKLAIESALEKSNLRGKEIQFLSTGTTQGDLPIPGFASMVHAGLDFEKCELASFQSVCASSMMALKNAYPTIIPSMDRF